MASPPPPPSLPVQGYGDEGSPVPPPAPPGRFSFLAAPGRPADQPPSSSSPSRFSFLAVQKQAEVDVKITGDTLAETTESMHEKLAQMPEVAAVPSAGVKGEPDRLVQALVASTLDHD